MSTLFRRGVRVFCDDKIRADARQEIVRRHPIQITHYSIVRKYLKLIIRKQDALKKIVFFMADKGEALFFQFRARAAGAGRAMMTVSDVEI